MNDDAVSPAATSTWSALWSGAGRVLRRCTMPLAWAVTLSVCAVSAFAVRDVVFPSLAPSASPSLWQPQPGDSTSTVAGVGSTEDRLDETTALSTTDLVVPTADTVLETTVAVPSSGASSVPTSIARRSSSGGGSSPTVTTAKPRTSTSTPTSGVSTTSTIDDDDQSPSTTSGGATTTTGPDPSTTVTETTDPVTTDTLPGDPVDGASGSGRRGRIDDSHP